MAADINFRGELGNNEDKGNALHKGPRQVPFLNSVGPDILAGDLVILQPAVVGTEGYNHSVQQAPAASAPGFLVGAAVENIPTGQWGQVQVEGDQEGVNMAAAVVAGDFVGASATVPGQVDVVAAGSEALAPGFVMEPASGTAAVHWINRLQL